MNGRIGFHDTKKRFFDNYKVIAEFTITPLWYNLNMFLYRNVEGTAMGLLVLPVTLTITPVLMAASVVALAANTTWGLGALPAAAIKEARRSDMLENNVVRLEEVSSTSMDKMQVLFANQMEVQQPVSGVNRIVNDENSVLPSQKSNLLCCSEHQCDDLEHFDLQFIHP